VLRRTVFLFLLISSEQGFKQAQAFGNGCDETAHQHRAASGICAGLPDLDVSGHTHYEAGALAPHLLFRSPSILVTADPLPEPAIVSAQALFLQGAKFTVLELTLRKEPDVF